MQGEGRAEGRGGAKGHEGRGEQGKCCEEGGQVERTGANNGPVNFNIAPGYPINGSEGMEVMMQSVVLLSLTCLTTRHHQS